MATIGLCRLCNEKKLLRDSHIISAFFFRLQKQFSATQKYVDINYPKKRPQDGQKLPFLCHECEQKFGDMEKEFSYVYKKIFNLKKISKIDVPNSIYRFIISLVWRQIGITLEIDKKTNYHDFEIGILEYQFEQMRLYLLHEEKISNEVHMIPLPLDRMPDNQCLQMATYAFGSDVMAYSKEALI